MERRALIATSMCLFVLLVQKTYCYRPQSTHDSFSLLEDTILFAPEDTNFSNLLTSVKRKIDSNDKTCTIVINMAADNDLYPFAGRNIKQMKAIGSNERIKIIVFFHMHKPGKEKATKRLLIEKNQILQIGSDLSMDSGSADTLIECFKWSVNKFPADEYALILWNHGTGIINPDLKSAVNPSNLYYFNTEKSLIELDRSIGLLDYLENPNINLRSNSSFGLPARGICFDDTTGHYLTMTDLKRSVKTICSECLNGGRLSLLACDTCLMSMIECVAPLEEYVEYFVGSQEVELGTGYNYTKVLSPLTTKSLSPRSFATHIVTCFAETYEKITNDYTQSAIDLSHMKELSAAIDTLGHLLITGLKHQKNKSVKEAIRLSRDRRFCTHFDEPTFLDLGSFVTNIIKNSSRFNVQKLNTEKYKKKVVLAANRVLNHLEKSVIANVNGKYFKHISGLSIYFPNKRIHKSYHDSEFAKKTSWLKFVKEYLKP